MSGEQSAVDIPKGKQWTELIEYHFPQKKLATVLEEGLAAEKPVVVSDGKDLGAHVEMHADYAVRHSYMETGMKLHGLLRKDIQVQNNFSLVALRDIIVGDERRRADVGEVAKASFRVLDGDNGSDPRDPEEGIAGSAPAPERSPVDDF